MHHRYRGCYPRVCLCVTLCFSVRAISCAYHSQTVLVISLNGTITHTTQNPA